MIKWSPLHWLSVTALVGSLCWAQAPGGSPQVAPPTQDAPANQDSSSMNSGIQAGAQSNGITSEIESFLEPYIYDPKGRRDPFKPYTESRALEEGEMAGPLLPLQQYELDQLKLVGIIWNVNDPKAMFIDPKKQVHIVRRDERIGRKKGYVAVIREGEVVIVEAVDVNGDLMYSTRVLKIKGRVNPDST